MNKKTSNKKPNKRPNKKPNKRPNNKPNRGKPKKISDRVKLYNIKPYLSVSRKVCVVGNSDCLLRSEYGREIDVFDDVIRFNFANIDKKHTGSKTTIRWVSCPIAKPFAREHNKDLRNMIQYYNYGKEIFSGIKVISRNSSHKYIQNFTKDVKCYKPNEFYSLRRVNRYLKELGIDIQFKIVKNCKPRSGLIAILTLIKSGCRPFVYGFDTEKKPVILHYSLNHRYIVNKIKIHQINLEVDVLKKLEEKKLITIRR